MFSAIPEIPLLIAQLVISSMMTGMIWQVQLLTYPQFRKISAKSFHGLHAFHSERMGWLVMIPMILELALATLYLFAFQNIISLLAFVAVSMIWASTAFLQVPLHWKLGQGHDPVAIDRLVRTNWIRTALWSIRTALLTAMLLKATNTNMGGFFKFAGFS